MAEKRVIDYLSSLSFLGMVIFILLFLFVQSLNPGSQFASLSTILTGYTVVFAILLSAAWIYSPETVRSLVKANYWKSFGLKFIPNAIVISIALYFLKTLIKSTTSINFIQGIANVPITILFVHLFVITQIEEIGIGIVYNAVKKDNGDSMAHLISAFVFAIFHFAKSGANFVILLTYIPLRLWWNFQNQQGTPFLRKLPLIGPILFGPTPATQQSGAGAHFAWNMFITAFIDPFRV